MLKFWVVWFYVGLMQTTAAAMSSWVQMQCHVHKTVFHSILYLLSVLQLLNSFHNALLALVGLIIDALSGWTANSQSLISYSLYFDELWMFALTILHCRRKYHCPRLRSELVYGHKHKYLEGNPVSKTKTVSSSRVYDCFVHGFWLDLRYQVWISSYETDPTLIRRWLVSLPTVTPLLHEGAYLA